MLKVLLAGVFVCCLCLTGMAQENYPKAEIFGGYSYFRGDEAENLHGWGASLTGNVNKWFGVTADFSGHYGQDFLRVEVPGQGFIDAESNNDVHNILFGPRLSYREHRTLDAFVHTLVGWSRSHVDASVSTPGFSSRVEATDTAFAFAFGGGLDAKVHKRVAWRVFQADYLLTRFANDNQHNFRVSTGVVIRFGN